MGAHSEGGEGEPDVGDDLQHAAAGEKPDAPTGDGNEHVEGDEEGVDHATGREVFGDDREHEAHDADLPHARTVRHAAQ